MNGVLLIDKPVGITSHDVVASVRRALGGVKTGHAGTLDPFATGLLIVLVGRATRIQQQLMGLPKRYETRRPAGGGVEHRRPGGGDHRRQAASHPTRRFCRQVKCASGPRSTRR